MLQSARYFLVRWMLPLVAIALSPTLLAAQSSAWTNLQQLKPGQQVRVVRNDARSFTGTFENADDKAITIRSHGTDRTLSRLEVRRVAARSAGHRVRHVVIGAAIGAGAGVGIGAAVGSSTGIVKRGPAIAVTAPAAAFLGAVIGAAVSSGHWKTVYPGQQ